MRAISEELTRTGRIPHTGATRERASASAAGESPASTHGARKLLPVAGDGASATDHERDLELLGRLRANEADVDAESVLYAAYLGRVQDYAYVILNDLHEAEDVAQEVMTRVMRKAKGFAGRGTVEAWIFGIARNCALTHLSRRRGTAFLEAGQLEELVADEAYDRTAVWASQLTIREGVKRLPDDQRQAIVLRFYLGLKLRDVGRRLGCSEDLAGDRVQAALKALDLQLHGRARQSGRVHYHWSVIRLRVRPVLRQRRWALLYP